MDYQTITTLVLIGWFILLALEILQYARRHKLLKDMRRSNEDQRYMLSELGELLIELREWQESRTSGSEDEL